MNSLTPILSLSLLSLVACAEPKYSPCEETKVEMTSASPEEDRPFESTPKEYCVLATDDSPVSEGGLESTFFYNTKLSSSTYRRFSSETRVPTNQFRIGDIPEDVNELGYPSTFISDIKRICTENGSGLDGRARFIFTGEKFQREKTEFGLIPEEELREDEMVSWWTKAGRVIDFKYGDEIFTVVYFDNNMISRQ